MLTSYQIECENCKTVFNIPVVFVGTTWISEPPMSCTVCSGTTMKNLSMNFREKKNLLT